MLQSAIETPSELPGFEAADDHPADRLILVVFKRPELVPNIATHMPRSPVTVSSTVIPRQRPVTLETARAEMKRIGMPSVGKGGGLATIAGGGCCVHPTILID